MAVRVVHKPQHHPLGVARRAAPKPHTRGAVRRARAHTKQFVAQRRAQSVVMAVMSRDMAAKTSTSGLSPSTWSAEAIGTHIRERVCQNYEIAQRAIRAL